MKLLSRFTNFLFVNVMFDYELAQYMLSRIQEKGEYKRECACIILYLIANIFSLRRSVCIQGNSFPNDTGIF
jgi:hypothetical protein